MGFRGKQRHHRRTHALASGGRTLLFVFLLGWGTGGPRALARAAARLGPRDAVRGVRLTAKAAVRSAAARLVSAGYPGSPAADLPEDRLQLPELVSRVQNVGGVHELVGGPDEG